MDESERDFIILDIQRDINELLAAGYIRVVGQDERGNNRYEVTPEGRIALQEELDNG